MSRKRKIALRWEFDDKRQNAWLFAGALLIELAWLEKRAVRWSAVIWLPNVDVGKRYNTLEAHQKHIEELVRHFFEKAMEAPVDVESTS